MKFTKTWVGMGREVWTNFLKNQQGKPKGGKRKIKIVGAGICLYLMRGIAFALVSIRANYLICLKIARTISVSDNFCCSHFFHYSFVIDIVT